MDLNIRGENSMKLEGCSNSGFSLTEVRKSQILELYQWVNSNIEYEKTYKQIQEDIENSCKHLDASKVRMLVPFLRKMGYISNYGFEQKNSIIKLVNFFTIEGKVFIEYLKLGQIISLLDQEDISNEMKRIDELFSMISMLNLIFNGEEIYVDVIKFLKKYRHMDKNEFFIMTTLQNQYECEEYIQMLDKYIKQYRNGEIGQLEIVKHQNSFNYVKSLLIETSLIVQDRSILSLNKKHDNLLNLL